jgi:hypothetical protein
MMVAALHNVLGTPQAHDAPAAQSACSTRGKPCQWLLLLLLLLAASGM